VKIKAVQLPWQRLCMLELEPADFVTWQQLVPPLGALSYQF